MTLLAGGEQSEWMLVPVFYHHNHTCRIHVYRGRCLLCHRTGKWEEAVKWAQRTLGEISRGNYQTFVFYDYNILVWALLSSPATPTYFQKHKIPDTLMTTFLEEHYKACEMGDHGHENNNIQWDYISSLFFTGTILTTIGILENGKPLYYSMRPLHNSMKSFPCFNVLGDSKRLLSPYYWN